MDWFWYVLPALTALFGFGIGAVTHVRLTRTLTEHEMQEAKVKTYRRTAAVQFRKSLEAAEVIEIEKAKRHENNARWYMQEAARIEAGLPAETEKPAEAGKLSLVAGEKKGDS